MIPGHASAESFQAMLTMLLEIAVALKYLHGINIVHGDLKRANVLRKSVGGFSICKVTDFGMAHVMQGGQDYYFSDRIAGRPPVNLHAP